MAFILVEGLIGAGGWGKEKKPMIAIKGSSEN